MENTNRSYYAALICGIASLLAAAVHGWMAMFWSSAPLLPLCLACTVFSLHYVSNRITSFRIPGEVLRLLLMAFFSLVVIMTPRISYFSRVTRFRIDQPKYTAAMDEMRMLGAFNSDFAPVMKPYGTPGCVKHLQAGVMDSVPVAAFTVAIGFPVKSSGFLYWGGEGQPPKTHWSRTSPVTSGWYYFSH